MIILFWQALERRVERECSGKEPLSHLFVNVGDKFGVLDEVSGFHAVLVLEGF